jgi:hypothetical protein
LREFCIYNKSNYKKKRKCRKSRPGLSAAANRRDGTTNCGGGSTVNRNVGCRILWMVAHRKGLLQFTYWSLPAAQKQVCMEMKMKDVKMNE